MDVVIAVMETKDWVTYLCAGAGLLATFVAILPTRLRIPSAIFALLLFVTAGIVGFSGGGSTPPTAATSQARPGVTTEPNLRTENPMTETTTSTTGVGSVKRTTDKLVVPRRYSVDLDSDAPDWGVSGFIGGETDFWLPNELTVEKYGPDYPFNEAGLFGRHAPNFEDCAAFTNWEKTAREAGTYYCVKTSGGDLARVLVKNPDSTSAVLAITVWRQKSAY